MGWFEDRRELDRRWRAWCRRLRLRGTDFIVRIPLSRHWPDIEKRFPISYDDRRGGSVDLLVARALLRLDDGQVIAIARKLAPRLPVGRCDECRTRALLTRHHGRGLCHGCLRKAIEAWAARDAERRKELLEAERARARKRGYKYLLELWIHPKSGADDRLIRRPFKTRPSRAKIREIARKGRSAILGDYSVTTL